MATLIAVGAIFWIIGNQRAFELQRWNERLGDAAANAAGVSGRWLAESQAMLGGAAANPTVQIYLSELSAAQFDRTKVAQEEIKRSFVGSYIQSFERRGISGSPLPPGATGSGVMDVALFAADGSLVATTPGYATAAEKPDFAQVAGSVGKIDGLLWKGRAAASIVVPVMPVQSTVPDPAPVGFVVGFRPLDDAIWTAFGNMGGPDIAVLLLSRTSRGVLPLGPSAASLTAEQHDAAGIETRLPENWMPGALGRAETEEGRPVLFSGRAVEGSSWMTVATVSEARALSGVEGQLRNLLVNLLLGLLAAIAAVFALWRHGAALHAAEAARLAREHARTLAVDQRKKLHLYRHLADALLEAIDRRDMGAAAHSRRVAELAEKLSRLAGASEDEVETTRLAGALLNAGKLFVPESLLTKEGPLSAHERQQIASGAEQWLGVLSHIPLDLPVASVLRQANELMRTGRDPGEPDASIGREARIVVVANGYVALTSPRAYRSEKSPTEAITQLKNSAKMTADIVEMLMELPAGDPKHGANGGARLDNLAL